jgi:hypothetical protein
MRSARLDELGVGQRPLLLALGHQRDGVRHGQRRVRGHVLLQLHLQLLHAMQMHNQRGRPAEEGQLPTAA